MTYKWTLGALAASLLLASCKLEAPEIPAQELYLRAFIKEFGIVDPTNDFNCAVQSEVTLLLEAPVQEATVIAKVGDYYYRVAAYAHLSGTSTIPIDIPDSCEDVYVYADGRICHATPGGTVTIGPNRGYKVDLNTALQSRDGDDLDFDFPYDLVAYLVDNSMRLPDMRWIMAVEDLGTTDDFDFNDVVIGIETVNVNKAAVDIGLVNWQVIKDEENIGLQKQAAPARATATGDETTRLRVTALAAGGTLPIWLHFRDPANGTDWIVCPNGDSPLAEASSIASYEDHSMENEWHSWFTGNLVGDYTHMMNTYYPDQGVFKGKSVTFYTEATYSLSQYCYIDYDAYRAELEAQNINVDDTDWTTKVALLNFFSSQSQVKVHYECGFLLSVHHPSHEGNTDGVYLGINIAGLPPEVLFLPDVNPSTSHSERTNGWEWPTERTDIRKVYPTFDAWVRSKADNKWFMYPDPNLALDDEFSRALRYDRSRLSR